MPIKCQELHRTIYVHLILTTTLTLKAKYHLHLPDEQMKIKKTERLHKGKSQDPNTEEQGEMTGPPLTAAGFL